MKGLGQSRIFEYLMSKNTFEKREYLKTGLSSDCKKIAKSQFISSSYILS